MKTYRIENRVSGINLGIYQGETPEDALRNMYRDAGYNDPSDAPGSDEDLDITEIESGYRPAVAAANDIGLRLAGLKS